MDSGAHIKYLQRMNEKGILQIKRLSAHNVNMISQLYLFVYILRVQIHKFFPDKMFTK